MFSADASTAASDRVGRGLLSRRSQSALARGTGCSRAGHSLLHRQSQSAPVQQCATIVGR